MNYIDTLREQIKAANVYCNHPLQLINNNDAIEQALKTLDEFERRIKEPIWRLISRKVVIDWELGYIAALNNILEMQPDNEQRNT